MQHIVDGRFVENKLVSWMVNKIGLTEIYIKSREDGFDDNDDYDQLLQLIGYSTSAIPYLDKDKHCITDTDSKPEDVFEKKYKELKKDLAPIMSELFNIHENDLSGNENE